MKKIGSGMLKSAGFYYLFILMTAICCSALTIPAFAQILEATRESERILREQQLRKEEDRLKMESHRPPAKIEAPQPATPKGAGTGCWNITRIVFAGADHMPQAKQQRIIKSYINRCLGVEEVQGLLSDITRFYIEKGYATARAYLPEQDLASKTLRIDVIEGKIEKLQLQKDDKGSLYLPGAFPGVTGRIMNLRDFEQGLDQVNRLSSNNATIDIAPGSKPGDSIVTIKNTPSKRWHLSVTGDNYGTRSTGTEQASATGTLDNALGINDLISITGRRSTSLEDLGRYSNSVNGFFSAPYGYALLTLGWSWSEYESELTTAGPTLALNGNSKSAFFAVDHTLYRGQDDKWTLSGTLTVKRQENFIAGQKLAVSSRPLTVMDVGTNYSRYLFGGSGSIGVNYARGLTILGAFEDLPGTPPDAPHAQFDKISANASWYRGFKLLDQDMSWSSALTAQKGFDTLYGTEQISIGGLYTVRGFFEESLANDTGGYIRNDLSMNKTVGTAWGRPVVARPYLALDAGKVLGETSDTPHGTLVGGGAGLGLTAGNVSFDIFTARPIIEIDSFGHPGFHTFGRVTAVF